MGGIEGRGPTNRVMVREPPIETGSRTRGEFSKEEHPPLSTGQSHCDDSVIRTECGSLPPRELGSCVTYQEEGNRGIKQKGGRGAPALV